MTYTAQVFLKPTAKPSHAEANVLRKYLSGSVRKIFMKLHLDILLNVVMSHVYYVLSIGVSI